MFKMRQLPDCLNRRYEELDKLFNELSSAISEHSVGLGPTSTADPGVKLMCKFWKILKENPDCDLKQYVQQKVAVNSRPSAFFKPQDITCFMACDDEKKDTTGRDYMNSCGKESPDSNLKSGENDGVAPQQKASILSSKQSGKKKEVCIEGDDILPLSKVLCNVNQAALFDKSCSKKINNLKEVQKRVSNQINHLEQREKEGVKLLKHADCLWTSMENSYKHKIADSIERQKILMEEQNLVEASLYKWRKNKKDLEFQVKNVDKCQQEITDKIHHKNSELKSIDKEIAGLRKRHDDNVSDIQKVKNSFSGKKKASDGRMSALNAQLKKLHQVVAHERELKNNTEQKGSKYVKQSREDLQQLCRALLRRKLENEDLRIECDAIVEEIDLLRKTTDLCRKKCKNKELSIEDELKKIDEEVANFRVKCTKCHASTDTDDAKRFCTDCPKCRQARECVYFDEYCTEDSSMDCICMTTKQKFLNNVFENMYSVLEKQVKTRQGKVLAEQIMECLKRSRNGKLDEGTRKAVQDFVMVTVKDDLNLTIIGGAAKTRCEMDPDTYNQLMMCLKLVKVDKPKSEKVDRGSLARKDPCCRWGNDNECNCPRGPMDCICTKKAPPPPTNLTSCPQLEEDTGQTVQCPRENDTLCSPDCANVYDTVNEMVASWMPGPCEGCTFSKNMRAAQCVLGSESLKNVSKFKNYVPIIPYISDLDGEMKSNCACGSDSPCTGDYKRSKDRRIENSSGAAVLINHKKTESTSKPSKVSSTEMQTKEIKKPKQQINTKLGHDCSLMEQNDLKCFSNSNTKKVKNMEKVTSIKINENVKEKAENEINGDVNGEVGIKPQKDGVVPFVQDEVKFFKENGTQSYITLKRKEQQDISLENISSLTKNNTFKDLFKVAISNESGEKNQEFTEMTKTSSGFINMALDEKTIQLIDSSTKENPNLFVILKKTQSGHFLVDFSKLECDSSESRRVVVNRTVSGNLLMEVHKDIVNKIQPNIIKKKEEANLQSSSVSIGLTTKTRSLEQNRQPLHGANDSKNDSEHHFGQEFNKECSIFNIKPVIEEKKGDHDISRHLIKPSKMQSLASSDLGQELIQPKLKSAESVTNIDKLFSSEAEQQNNAFKGNTFIKKQVTDKLANSEDVCVGFEEELIEMFKNKNTTLDVTILGDNVVELDLKAELTQTQSEHMAIDIQSMVYLGKIANQLKEYPVLLTKINSRYIINVSRNTDIANAVLRRTSSGEMYVVVKNPTHTVSENPIALLESREQLFKVRVKGVQRVYPEPSFVMRATPSGNYVFVLEKEFEKRYIKTVNEFVSDDSECPVELTKTESGCYIIDFEDCANKNKNALLVKSKSGNIKMLVKGSAFEAIQKAPSSIAKSSIVFGELFKQLPPSSREFHSEHFSKSKFLKNKSCSDSQLYDQVKIKDQKPLLTEPSAVLKKTASGQYAVVLNKESKGVFINNLTSYLSNSVQILRPIKKTDKGDIIISLNHDQGPKSHYGSLKITPSGNTYVLIDKRAIKEMENTATPRTAQAILSDPSAPSIHMIGTVVNPQNKGVTTTCHAKPDSCSCDKSKCVCKELPPSVRDYWTTTLQVKWNPIASYKTCDHNTCVEVGASRSQTTYSTDSDNSYQARDESPKCSIVHCSHPRSGKNPKHSEQCCYFIETTSPTNTNRNNSLPNDLKHIAAPILHDYYNDDVEITDHDYEKKYVEEVNSKPDLSNLDYLEYLPPQLPFFLRGSN